MLCFRMWCNLERCDKNADVVSVVCRGAPLLSRALSAVERLSFHKLSQNSPIVTSSYMLAAVNEGTRLDTI